MGIRVWHHHIYSESGEGWYVKISIEALTLLDNLNSTFFTIRKRIIRERNYEGHRARQIYNQTIDEWEKQQASTGNS